MPDHAPVMTLRVANEASSVSNTIDRCAKTMMIRELVANAMEAASGPDWQPSGEPAQRANAA